MVTTEPFAKNHCTVGVGVPKAKQGIVIFSKISTDALPGNLIKVGFAFEEKINYAYIHIYI